MQRHTESPDLTGRYVCPFCDNASRFLGYDDQGFPGDACCCGARDSEDDNAECICEVTLEQPIEIINGEPEYGAFIGGGNDATISSYTRIRCRECLALVYVDPAFTDEGIRKEKRPAALGGVEYVWAITPEDA